MKYKIIIAVILIIAFLVSGTLIYVNNVLLPVKIKARITQELAKNLGKNVRIEKLSYNLIKGLVIQNLVIYDQSEDQTYLSVKEASLNLLFFPLFKRKIIVPLLRIDSPKIYLKIKPDNTLNLMELCKIQTAQKEKPKFSFIISKIDLGNGALQFVDERLSPNYTKKITDLKIGAGLNLPGAIKFILQAKIQNFASGPSFVSASGEYNLFKQALGAKVKIANVIIDDYLLYLNKLPVSLSNGVVNADFEIGFKDKELEVKGATDTKGLNLKKEKFSLSVDINLEPEIKYNLENKKLGFKSALKLKTQALNAPVDIKGNLKLVDNGLNWENLVVTYKQAQFNSSGRITDFAQPKIDFNLSAKDFTADTSLIIQDKSVKVTSCSGKYLDSEFNLKGNINTQDQDNPLINLNLNLNVILKDTFGLLPTNIQDNLKNLKLAGQCKVTGNISGGIKELKDLNTDLKFTSDNLSIYDFKLDNLYFTLEQKNKLLNIRDFMAGFYSGNANLKFLMNLEPQTPTYTAKIMLSNIDLSKLKTDTPLKDKDISGLFSANLDLAGETVKLETLQGQGVLSVKEGKLWELDLFKGLGELLFMPIYQNIIFKDMNANFTIKDKAINIVDSFLGSEKLELSCAGRLGFDGALDLTFNSQINAELIKDSTDLRKFTSAILGNILVVKIGGTIQKPEYKIVPGTKEIINQLKDLFFGR